MKRRAVVVVALLGCIGGCDRVIPGSSGGRVKASADRPLNADDILVYLNELPKRRAK